MAPWYLWCKMGCKLRVLKSGGPPKTSEHFLWHHAIPNMDACGRGWNDTLRERFCEVRTSELNRHVGTLGLRPTVQNLEPVSLNLKPRTPSLELQRSKPKALNRRSKNPTARSCRRMSCHSFQSAGDLANAAGVPERFHRPWQREGC